MKNIYPLKQNGKSWRPLVPGDLIDVLAPAWPCKKSELLGGIRFLHNLGFRTRHSPRIFVGGSMFSSPDEERLKQLKKALYAEDSSAVWCVRGGYGSLRLLPSMWHWKAPRRLKPLIGFSDITTLHTFLNSQWGWPTIHGPLLDRFGRGDHKTKETRELLGMLLGLTLEVEFKGLKAVAQSQRPSGKLIRGPVVGGNLAVIQSSMGTPYAVVPKGCIVFFEDVGERPHRVDRMLTQLMQAGYFSQVKAVVFGPMLVGQRRDHQVLWNEVLPRFAREVNFPVLKGMSVGHGEVQRPLPFLTPSVLDVARGVLKVTSGMARHG